MGPIRYEFDVESPFKAALQGFQAGAGIKDVLDQRALAEQQRAAQEQARAQMHQDLATLTSKPNVSASEYAALVLRYPQLKDQFKQSWDAMSAERRQAKQDQGSKAFAAIQAGRPDIAEQLFRDRAAAMRNSGAEQEAKQEELMAELIKLNPGMARTTVATSLASLDPDKFAETFSKLGAEARADELQPGLVRKGTADADKAVADATTAGVGAKYAEPLKAAEVQQASAQLGLTKAQTAQAMATTRKLSAEVQRAALEAQTGDPNKRFDFESKLRGEFVKQIGAAVDTQQAYERVRASKDDAVGDLSLIFGYMKMLDPGSVVREGEFATAQNAAGVPTKVANLYNRVMSGERLSPGQRQAFMGQAGDLAAVADKRIKSVKQSLMPAVKNYRLDENNIFGTLVPSAPPAPAPQPGAPARVATDADYNALPSGATFIAPDGSTRRKP